MGVLLVPLLATKKTEITIIFKKYNKIPVKALSMQS